MLEKQNRSPVGPYISSDPDDYQLDLLEKFLTKVPARRAQRPERSRRAAPRAQTRDKGQNAEQTIADIKFYNRLGLFLTGLLIFLAPRRFKWVV